MRAVGADRTDCSTPALAIEYPGKFSLRAPRFRALASARLCSAQAGWVGAKRTPSASSPRAAPIASPPTGRSRAARAHRRTGALAICGNPCACRRQPGRLGLGRYSSTCCATGWMASAGERLSRPACGTGRAFPQPAAAFCTRQRRARCAKEPVRTLDKTGDSFVLDDRPRAIHMIVAVGPHQLDACRAVCRARADAPARSGFRLEPIYTCYLRYPQKSQCSHDRPTAARFVDIRSGQAEWLPVAAAVIGARGSPGAFPGCAGRRRPSRLAAFLPGLPQPLWSA